MTDPTPHHKGDEQMPLLQHAEKQEPPKKPEPKSQQSESVSSLMQKLKLLLYLHPILFATIYSALLIVLEEYVGYCMIRAVGYGLVIGGFLVMFVISAMLLIYPQDVCMVIATIFLLATMRCTEFALRLLHCWDFTFMPHHVREIHSTMGVVAYALLVSLTVLIPKQYIAMTKDNSLQPHQHVRQPRVSLTWKRLDVGLAVLVWLASAVQVVLLFVNINGSNYNMLITSILVEGSLYGLYILSFSIVVSSVMAVQSSIPYGTVAGTTNARGTVLTLLMVGLVFCNIINLGQLMIGSGFQHIKSGDANETFLDMAKELITELIPVASG